jgi:biopolymer transport protein TolQ
MSFWSLFMEATIVVKLIMFLLIILSVYSWGIILKKHIDYKKRGKEIEEIKKISNPHKGWNTFLNNNNTDGYFTNVIKSGYSAINSKKISNSTTVEEVSYFISNVKDNMDVSIEREIQKIKKHNASLATIGSVSPYIGLLGTVWGIMHAFIAIGAAKQATLEYVAPSIAEALIATAIALCTAIPAYIFYNIYQNKQEELTEEYQLLTDEFCLSAKDKISSKIKDKPTK